MSGFVKYFLSYRFDEQRGTISRGSTPVEITRKAASVLRCLIESAGTTVSHEAILTSVWPDAHVQPDNIKVLVRELRRALGDDSQAPYLIRTDPGRGYTFIAPVSDAPLPIADERDGRGPSVFVNHEDDLVRLADALADASLCQLAVIEGERGIGKTALCDAFLQRIRSTPSVHVCYGQCLKHAGRPEPYSAVIDALDHLARQLPNTIPALLRRTAPGWLQMLPHRGSEIAAADAPPPDAWRSIRELSDFLEVLASEATTVLVLEDLHWGNLDTIELLRGLSRRRAPLRTLIIATCAPFESTIAAAALRNLTAEMTPAGRCLSIRLAPLSQEHVRTYLAERFQSDTIVAIAPVLHRLTAGNPLALVSATDALVDRDYFVHEAGGWRSRYSPRTLEASLPEPILDILYWQFDHLGPDDRALLEAAAVVGTEFTPDDVAIAAGFESAAVVARRLESLQGRGFVARRGSGRWASRPEVATYRFLHPLHAEMLASRAPVFQQLRVAERLGRTPQQIGRLREFQ